MAASSSLGPPTMSASRTTCVRCFSSITRFRSTTTRWRWSAFMDCRWPIANQVCNLKSAILNLQSAISLMITLTLKDQPSVPLEAEVISPDVMAGLVHDDIRALPVYLGKRQKRLDDFFDVEGAASDQIEIRGDAAKVKYIGRGMTR